MANLPKSHLVYKLRNCAISGNLSLANINFPAYRNMESKSIIFSNYDDLKNPFYGGGGAVSVHEMAKRFAVNNSVTVITSKFPGSLNETVEGVNYVRIGLALFGPRISQLVFQLFLPFYFIRQSFDIWIESITPPVPFNMLQIFSSKPVIAMVHMLPGEDMERKYHLPFRFFERFFIRRYKYFAVVTDYLNAQIAEINPKAKIFTVPNGLDEKFLTEGIFSEDCSRDTIFYLGRIEINQKGLDLLLESYKKIANTINLKLVIAGSGLESDQAYLRKKIEALSLQDRVKAVGRVNNEQKIELLKHAAFMVIPSRFETFGLVALESMAFGVPVVSFDINGLKWLPENTCLKASPFDTTDFSEKMSLLAKAKELHSKLSKSCKVVAEGFTWNNSYFRLEKMVETII